MKRSLENRKLGHCSKRRYRIVMLFCMLLVFTAVYILSIGTKINIDYCTHVIQSIGKKFWNSTSNVKELKDPEPWLKGDTFNLTIWSSDFHISPIHDVKDLLTPLGVKFIDQSLSGACGRTGTCAKNLKVLNQGKAQSLPDNVIKEFYEAYKNDSQMNTVDAFLCFHPASLCELYMQFNRSIIVYATTRYELGRHDAKRWTKWNENLKAIAKIPGNVVAGNSVYEARYVSYFTGLDVQVLQSYCGYTGVTYDPKAPKKTQILLNPTHKGSFQKLFEKQLQETKTALKSDVLIAQTRSLYPKYKYSDLVSHPAIIHIPYQVSVMSLFEHYRMNIPLIFPSLELLSKWQFEHQVLNERTWDGVWGKRPKGSVIGGAVKEPDPNNEQDLEAISYWLKFSDFYQWPHITYFNSYEDLFAKIKTMDFAAISERMREHNAKLKKELVGKWKKILYDIEQARIKSSFKVL